MSVVPPGRRATPRRLGNEQVFCRGCGPCDRGGVGCGDGDTFAWVERPAGGALLALRGGVRCTGAGSGGQAARCGGLRHSVLHGQVVHLAHQVIEAGQQDLFDVLVREHLLMFPDDLLASWIAGRS